MLTVQVRTVTLFIFVRIIQVQTVRLRAVQVRTVWIPFCCGVQVGCVWFLRLGSLFTGDEVLEWNGCNLQNLSFDEVYDIIFESKMEPQVELIVQRKVR